MAGYGGKDSLYEVLGVNRSSNAAEIARAYKKLRAELEKDAADPQRAALLHQAHEVLADPHSRAAYDASLRSNEFLRPERKVAPALKWGPIVAGLVVVLAGLWFLLRPSGDAERIPQEIVAAASPAVGRVHSIDISGRATPLGHAFAIDQGVMLTTCQGFKANTQLVVKLGTRLAPAQISKSDPKRNICRLTVVGAGSWPLGIGPATPKKGDKIYAASTTEAGEATIFQGEVESLLAIDGARALELSFPVTPGLSGGPILDTRGRVVGMMAAQHGFAGKHVALPASWIQEHRSRDR